MRTRHNIFLITSILLLPYLVTPQTKKKKDVYEFELLKTVKTTQVKDQGKTNTSWSFAAMSFFESELIRMGKGEHNLSTMFNSRCIYPVKAENFVRRQGSSLFDADGLAHDVLYVMRDYGIMPDSVYPGNDFLDERFNMTEMDALLKSFVEVITRNKGERISRNWKAAFESILNIYLGAPSKEFIYRGKTFSPKSFLAETGIIPDDYIEITSFTHHPFYTKFSLEIPANFTNESYYNVTIDDMVKIIDAAIDQGYSVGWAGDVTEKSFDKKKSIATIPAESETETGTDFLIREKTITQEMRQQSFEDQTSTCDHNMHIVGIAKDINGNKYYYTKNSSGSENKKYDGYVYLSEPYVRLKTVSILINKHSLPEEIKNKLGI